MAKIELNTRDLQVKTLDDGREVVQLKGSGAFDPTFIVECKELGVLSEIKKEE